VGRTQTFLDPATFAIQVLVPASVPTVGIATGDASPSGNALLSTSRAPAWGAGYNSVSVWLQVYPHDVSGDETALDLNPGGAAAGRGCGVSVNGGQVGLYTSNTYNATTQAVHMALPQDDRLHHVVFSFPSGAFGPGDVLAWLDAMPQTLQGSGGTATLGSYLLVGGIGPAGPGDQGAHFDGWLSELYLYSRQLTQEDVDGLYSGTPTGYGLIAAYPMREGFGSTLRDAVAGNDLNLAAGTAVGWWTGTT
jgi:hypothetical protein